MASVKVSLNLPESMVTELRDIAEKRDTTVTEFIRDSISKKMFFDRQLEVDGTKILIESPDRKLREVVFPEIRRHMT